MGVAQGGRFAVLPHFTNTVEIRDTISGALVTELRGNQATLDAVFSPDGKRILTRDDVGQTLRVWDLKGNEVWSVQFENTPFQASWSPDGNSILVCEGNDIHLYRSIPWPELAQLGDADATLENRIALWDKAQTTER